VLRVYTRGIQMLHGLYMYRGLWRLRRMRSDRGQWQDPSTISPRRRRGEGKGKRRREIAAPAWLAHGRSTSLSFPYVLPRPIMHSGNDRRVNSRNRPKPRTLRESVTHARRPRTSTVVSHANRWKFSRVQAGSVGRQLQPFFPCDWVGNSDL
jgi:hypothetical protein